MSRCCPWHGEETPRTPCDEVSRSHQLQDSGDSQGTVVTSRGMIPGDHISQLCPSGWPGDGDNGDVRGDEPQVSKSLGPTSYKILGTAREQW